jgi:hypothetical protein
MKKLFTNWKTTLGALGTILVLAGDSLKAITDNDPTTNPDIKLILATAGLVWSALFAKDATDSPNDEGPKDN